MTYCIGFSGFPPILSILGSFNPLLSTLRQLEVVTHFRSFDPFLNRCVCPSRVSGRFNPFSPISLYYEWFNPLRPIVIQFKNFDTFLPILWFLTLFSNLRCFDSYWPILVISEVWETFWIISMIWKKWGTKEKMRNEKKKNKKKTIKIPFWDP